MEPEWPDFVGEFLELVEDAKSPLIFKKWTAIATIACALERRVWFRTKRGNGYPNLYTLLVAPPGIGKQVLDIMKDLLREAKAHNSTNRAFCIAPNNVTKASLLDVLSRSKNTKQIVAMPVVERDYCSLSCVAEEFSVLLPAYDLEYIGVLNQIFNNISIYDEERRSGTVKKLEIFRPQLNIIGGAQPGWLGNVFPEEAWGMGLASRLILIYASESPKDTIFSSDPDGDAERFLLKRAKVLRSLTRLSSLYGPIRWEPDAADYIETWYHDGLNPVPQHSKLSHYNNRRDLHLLKLSVIAAISATGQLIVRKADVVRAMAWMFEAESIMPDIFRAMVGKSDAQVLEELHFFVSAKWGSLKGKPVPAPLIIEFLAGRVPSEKVEKILAIAERSSVLKFTPEGFIPRPRHEFGVE